MIRRLILLLFLLLALGSSAFTVYIYLVRGGKVPIVLGSSATVSVKAYLADGRTVTLPVILHNDQTDEKFEFSSDQAVSVVPGTYSLSVGTFAPYQVSGLALKEGQTADIPIAFGELTFSVVDATGKTTPTTLLVKGDQKGDQEATVSSNTPVAARPGSYRVTVSPQDSPASVQTISLDIAPAQRLAVQLRSELFGSGIIKVILGKPDGPGGRELEPVQVRVYAPDGETSIPPKSPIDTFMSNAESRLLPVGKYVISVGRGTFPISGRYEVTIQTNQTVTVEAAMGYLTLRRVDAASRPVEGGGLVYIALTSEMQRLGKSIVDMRGTDYGVAPPELSRVAKYLLPAGTYSVQLGDRSYSNDGVVIEAGKTTTVDIKVP